MNNETIGRDELNNLLSKVEDELLYHMDIVEKAIKASLLLKSNDNHSDHADNESDYTIAKSFIGDCSLTQLEFNTYDIFDAVDKFISVAEKHVMEAFDMNKSDDDEQE